MVRSRAAQNVSEAEALALAQEAVAEGSAVALGAEGVTAGTQLYTAAGWGRLCGGTRTTLGAFHREFPLREGMTREELRSRLGLRGNAAQAALDRLVADGVVSASGGVLRLPEHSVEVTSQQRAAMDAFIVALERDPFPQEAPSVAPELLALLAEQGRVVRAAQGVVFDAATYERLAGEVTSLLRAQGKVTVAEVRDLLGTSRKYTLALLEHLDDEKVTRRVGGRADASGGVRGTPLPNLPPSRGKGSDPPPLAQAVASTAGLAAPLRQRPRATTSSAICTALVAAPLRRLSETSQRARPFGSATSSRMRPTNTSSLPSPSRGMG